MATKQTGVVKKKPIGKNIRFSNQAYKLIKVFCKKNGYRIGSFCEIAAMDKINSGTPKLYNTRTI